MKIFTLLEEAGLAERLTLSKQAHKRLQETEVGGVCSDSRHLRAGDLFVAVKGLHTDGHRYIEDAIGKGACGVIFERGALGEDFLGQLEIPGVAVENSRAALACLCAAVYGHPQRQMKMVGVTGTNGKTSVSRLLYEILSRSGKRCGVIGTTGCFTVSGRINIRSEREDANMTTPDPEELFKILSVMESEGVETVIMEVSSHALAFSKVEPILFDVAVFTNLSEDHLDLHGDMEHYFAAKAKLLGQSRRAVVNLDDYYGRRLATSMLCPVYGCSAEGRDACFALEDLHLKGAHGIEYKISSPSLRMRVRSPLCGGFNVMNTAEAAVVARFLGIEAGEIRTALSSFQGVEGRLERIKLPSKQEFAVYIDYAHTPDALENLLLTARSFMKRGQRLVVLFGCGGDREKQKRPLMGKIATELSDLCVITGDNSRSENPSDIIADILSGVSAEGCYTVIEDRRAAIEYVIKNARRGDVILLCGKGHEEYEIGRDGVRPFSEREILLSAVEKHRS